MPYQVIVSEGVLSRDSEEKVFAEITELLLSMHGLSGNSFMTPNVIGEITVVPEGRTFSGGRRERIAIVELKVPEFVLASQEARGHWVKGVTDIVAKHADPSLPRDRIYANISYAVNGGWGIAGAAYTNEELGNAISSAA